MPIPPFPGLSCELECTLPVGDDKTLDIVVEIFNNVNSGGTKLSKGDLALARICARWPEARVQMKDILARLKKARYEFSLDWLLRCVTVYTTGKAYFTELDDISTDAFQKGLDETSRLIDTILNQIASRLGLDDRRVLGSRYSIPTMIGYIRKVGIRNLDNSAWNKLLYWYVHSLLWGRYAGTLESNMNQDLNTIEAGEGVDGLLRQLRQHRGDLSIRPDDFRTWSIGSRFYPLLYMMTRVYHARDWCSGVELRNLLLGRLSSLDLHHIFPKAKLRKHGYSKADVNALANYAFQTKECNLLISDKLPSDYLPDLMRKHPAAVLSHWMPDNMEMYSLKRYPEFLQARRELLAAHANMFLDSLWRSTETVAIEDYVHRAVEEEKPKVDISDDEEEEMILSTSIWMEAQGLNPGIFDYELLDEDDHLLGIIDLAWPEGIQIGLSEPVALLINEPAAMHKLVNEQGYRYFTDADSFMEYVTANFVNGE